MTCVSPKGEISSIPAAVHHQRVDRAELPSAPAMSGSRRASRDADHLTAGARRIRERADHVHHRLHAELAANRPTCRIAGCMSGANMKTMPASRERALP